MIKIIPTLLPELLRETDELLCQNWWHDKTLRVFSSTMLGTWTPSGPIKQGLITTQGKIKLTKSKKEEERKTKNCVCC